MKLHEIVLNQTLKGKHKHHEAGEYSDIDQFGSELPAK